MLKEVEIWYYDLTGRNTGEVNIFKGGGRDNSPADIFLITSSFVQLHHFLKNDVVNIDNEYDECYYLNASLYPLMSKLMFKWGYWNEKFWLQ